MDLSKLNPEYIKGSWCQPGPLQGGGAQQALAEQNADRSGGKQTISSARQYKLTNCLA